MYFIGIDVGGTFTDVVAMDESGAIRTFKTESTPKDPSAGVIDGIRLAAKDMGMSIPDLLGSTAYFGHGTTVATNALLQRGGARTGLITTKGFGDTIFVQRMLGPTAGMGSDEIMHFTARVPPVPIVPPRLVREVAERVDYKGSVIVPLDEDGARRAIRELVDLGVGAVAVCFLWSFANPRHEEAVRDLLAREAPDRFITISSELVPVIGEYERMATTILNSYLGPSVATYITNLGKALAEMGLRSPLLIMNAVGGVLTSEEASKEAVSLLYSGPTGGVIGSIHLAEALGHSNVITTDMGGTSFDVSLIVDGRATIAPTSTVGKYHIIKPLVNIECIGAGGGSVARVTDGYLRVGPESAGADPGPVCYGKGGEEPTVTDADVVLGIIGPDSFLGGRKKLDKAKAESAIRRKVAEPLGLNVMEAAAGIRRVIDSQMADLLRSVTIEKGHDPRDFVLFAYGGAGPTHCSAYGAELGVKAIIVPLMATSHSAFGAVASDIRHSFEVSDVMRTPALFDRASKYLDSTRINLNLSRLEEKARLALQHDGIADSDMVFLRALDMRYRRQTHEVLIPIPEGNLSADDVDKLIDAFERKYEELYGKGAAYREAGVEVITFRVEAVGRMPRPRLRKFAVAQSDPAAALLGERQVYFYEIGGFASTRIFDGARVRAGYAFEGPAIIEHHGTTVVIGPGQRGVVDGYLNTVIEAM
ncbi:MAG: hydantoinase/oxoprolinase family protein [Chloroflexi bacterium]|nr:hydantoinase/oxoprolinase family protein [Chloroflexota bacterium]